MGVYYCLISMKFHLTLTMPLQLLTLSHLIIQTGIRNDPKSQVGIKWEDDCSVSEADPGCRDIGVRSFNTTQYSGRGSGSNTQEKYHQLPQYSEGHSPCDGPSSPSPFSS